MCGTCSWRISKTEDRAKETSQLQYSELRPAFNVRARRVRLASSSVSRATQHRKSPGHWEECLDAPQAPMLDRAAQSVCACRQLSSCSRPQPLTTCTSEIVNGSPRG